MNRFLFFFPLIVSLLLTSCSSSTITQQENCYTIGISQIGDDVWFKKMNAEMQQEALFHPEIKLIFRSGHYDWNLQRQQIDSFISQKVDLLIVGPSDENSVCEASNRAYDAGIPVVMTSHYDIGEKYTAFICMSNYEIGQSFAAFLEEVATEEQYTSTRPLQVIELVGPPDILPTQLRSRGMYDALKEHPNIRILARCVADWSRQDAYRMVDSLLYIYPEFRAIVAQNDEMAIGASKACAKWGLLPGMHIMGVDAMGGEGCRYRCYTPWRHRGVCNEYKSW